MPEPISSRAAGLRFQDPLARLKIRQSMHAYRAEISAMQEVGRDLDPVGERVQKNAIANRRRSERLRRRAAAITGTSETDQAPRRRSGPTRRSGTNTRRGGAGLFYQSNDWRPSDSPKRRMPGGLNPSTAGKRAVGSESTGTFFSRHGDRKPFARGIFGHSASRYRSAKEFSSNPNTWMRRSLVLWAADEVTRTMRGALNYDDVSYLDDHKTAESKIGEITTRDAIGAVTGAVVGVPLKIANWGARIGTLIGGAIFNEHAEAARIQSFFDEWTDVISGGFRGAAPGTEMDIARNVILPGLRRERADEVRKKSKARFSRMIDDTIDRMMDNLTLRGVGTIKNIVSTYKQSDSGKRALDRIKKAETQKQTEDRGDIMDEALKRVLAYRD